MSARSARADVRNPVLALPSFRALQSLLPEQRVLLVVLLLDLQSAARDRAARSWACRKAVIAAYRSEEHTSELQSLMRLSYAVFCLKKKNTYPPIVKCARVNRSRTNAYD